MINEWIWKTASDTNHHTYLFLDALSSEFQEVAEFIDNNDDKKDSVILGRRPIFWSVSPAVVYSIPLPRFILSSIETDD